MKRNNKTNFNLTPDNVRAGIEFFKETGQPFDVIVQTYTTRINGAGNTFLFMNKGQSNAMFAAYKKILADVKKFDDIFGDLVPDIKNPSYNENKINKEVFYPAVNNFDIKSAYLNALHTTGIISTATRDYCNNLTKPDRLACVGMLASKKNIFHYNEDGNLEGHSIERAEFSKYFFWAVNYIGEAMTDLMRMIELKDIFLFYWVDGIYCVSKQPENLFLDYVRATLTRDYGLEYTAEKLSAFKIVKKENKFELTYLKEGKQKRFQFSANNDVDKLKQQILNSLK